MKSILVAVLLLTACTTSATEFKFAPPGKAVCAPFEGSFSAADQSGPEERVGGSVRCTGSNEAMSCRITVGGETGPNVFKGAVGVEKGNTFVEAYVRDDEGRKTVRLMGCKLNGRCLVVQMFRPDTKVGLMCIDPTMAK